MKRSAELSKTLDVLRARGLDEAEALTKTGRGRRLERGPDTEVVSFHEERGWAVRAGGDRSSFFVCGTGALDPEAPWPEPNGLPIRLPKASPATAWNEPDDFDAPLVGEREGLRLLTSIEEELARELPGARLIYGVLEDGSSETGIVNTKGVVARIKTRVAALRLDAAFGRGGAARTAIYLAEREARRFRPRALARRLADQLAVAAPPAGEGRDRGEILLAPAVGQRMIAELLPLLVGPRAGDLASRLRDRRGRVASEHLTVIDDGRLAGGLFAAPADGEGVATRETVLIEGGAFRQPLLAWWQAPGGEARPAGCSRRASWRDLPKPGPTHLYVDVRDGVPVGGLLEEVRRGYYLIDSSGPASFDFEEDRFSLPVAGFAVHAGRATAPVSGASLEGGIGAFLKGIQALGRDLTFAPMEGMIGCPTLLVTGLEVKKGKT